MRTAHVYKVGALMAALVLAVPAAQAGPRKLLVISVDGLDWRDRDALGLKMPNIRRLLAKSQVADGVTGVWPTITWPSHTTMLTGARPDQHGILANAGGPPDPALSYWSATKIKVPTLTQCLASAGRTIGAVNWPVTVDAKINWNLPEVYARRLGDSSDMETVDHFGTPGLVDEIARSYPSFQQQWLDDRSRALATARPGVVAPGRTGFRGTRGRAFRHPRQCGGGAVGRTDRRHHQGNAQGL
jgi:arylsulfatase A-like enzyme